LKDIAFADIKKFNDDHLSVVLECLVGGAKRSGRRKTRSGAGRGGSGSGSGGGVNPLGKTFEGRPKNTLKKLHISTTDCILDKLIDRAEAIIDECDINAHRAIRVGKGELEREVRRTESACKLFRIRPGKGDHGLYIGGGGLGGGRGSVGCGVRREKRGGISR
jgi:hypothetical protein